MTDPRVVSARIIGSATTHSARVLTPEALEFVCRLHREFNPAREQLLAARADRRTRIEQGEALDFRADTAGIRQSDWQVADAPRDLDDRRVEITGPTDRKMMI